MQAQKYGEFVSLTWCSKKWATNLKVRTMAKVKILVFETAHYIDLSVELSTPVFDSERVKSRCENVNAGVCY